MHSGLADHWRWHATVSELLHNIRALGQTLTVETMYGQYNLMSHKGLGAQDFTHAFNNINYQGHYTQYMLHYTYNMHKMHVQFHQRHKYIK